MQIMTDNLEAHTRICCQMEAIAGSMEATLDARLTRLAAFMERRLEAARPRKGRARSRSTDSHLLSTIKLTTRRPRSPGPADDDIQVRARLCKCRASSSL